ncbi:MAG: hypothetical protein EOO08_02420 [Chitinophagaceae bacterium]|nr:MAG: hypothetical protein EOO08_02420 [Chitinophagaceae bacterium]
MTSTAPTVSEIVRQDYRAADVFKKWGINYCCGGNLPLTDVCHLQGLDQAAIESDLDAARRQRALSPGIAFNEWPVPFLIDYIQLVHHAYVRSTGAALGRQLHDFVKGHLKKYPYLGEVEEAFDALLLKLGEHMQEEEEKAFPYFRQVHSAHANREAYGKLFIRTMGKPLKAFGDDHRHVGPLLRRLRTLTAHYTFGEGACTNHQVLYHKLREFDEDLVQHMHLEHNVLFPRIQALEKELRAH